MIEKEKLSVVKHNFFVFKCLTRLIFFLFGEGEGDWHELYTV